MTYLNFDRLGETPISIVLMSTIALIVMVYLLPHNAAAEANRVLFKSPQAQLLSGMAAAIAFASVIITLYQFRVDLADRQEERTEFAWARLIRPAAGNTGKGSALNQLWNQEVPINGIDLSCRIIGAYDHENKKCISPPIFAGVNLKKASTVKSPISFLPFLARSVIKGVNFSDAQFESLELQNMTIEAVLTGIHVDGCRLSNIILRSSLSNAQFSACRISNSSFIGDLAGGQFLDSEISSVSFAPTGAMPVFKDSWTWADQPPRRSRYAGEVRLGSVTMSDNELEGITICDPASGRLPPVNIRIGMFKVMRGCEKITTGEAREKYPEAWRPLSF